VKLLLIALLILGFPLVLSAQVSPVGEFRLGNQVDVLTAVFITPELACGDYIAERRKDNSIERLFVGLNGGGGQPEVEIIVSCHALPMGWFASRDLDGDGDADILWLGVRGTDWDNSGMLEAYEHGYVSLFVDYDSDGYLEIVVHDTTRDLFDWQVKDLGLRPGPEVIYIGVLHPGKTGMGAAIIGGSDYDGDNEDEIVMLDTRLEEDIQAFNRGTRFDVDGDGDADIVIIRF
jgi:hypothetical protein